MIPEREKRVKSFNKIINLIKELSQLVEIHILRKNLKFKERKSYRAKRFRKNRCMAMAPVKHVLIVWYKYFQAKLKL